MRNHRLLVVTAMVTPIQAYASDYSGVPSLIRIPVLVIALIALGVISIFPASAAQKTGIAVVYVPLLFGGLVALNDAISVMRNDTGIAVVYIFLLFATLYVAVKLFLKPIVAPSGDQPES